VKARRKKLPSSSATSWRTNDALVLWLIGCAGFLAIVLSARGDLWLDEVISLQWARSAKTPWDLLALYHHDNNHPINSLWLLMVGESHGTVLPRLLSIVSGAIILFLMVKLGEVLCPTRRWVPLLLASFSFPMILYASEARGYAPALAANLGATWLLLKWRNSKQFPPTLAFGLLSIVAMLSHGSALHILAAQFLWFVLVAFQDERGVIHRIYRVLHWFGIPVLAGGIYYILFLREMMVAGGPHYSWVQVFGHFFGYSLGLPTEGIGGVFTTVVSILLIIAALVWGVFPIPCGRWLYSFILLVPAAVLLLTRPEFLYFRYFLVCLPYFYLLLGALSEALPKPLHSWKRIVVAVVVVAFVSTNVARVFALLNWQRGDYSGALRYVVDRSSGDTTISSDHDFRNGLVVQSLKRRFPEFSRIQYCLASDIPNIGTEWLILHGQGDPPAVTPEKISWENRSYSFSKLFPAGPVSGFYWMIFRRTDLSVE